MSRRFNLSEWALSHQTLVLYFMLVLAAVGVGAYLRLGQAEDPDFSFKLMVVRTMWPGASAEEVERQLTDRIEKKLQETPRLDFLRSYSKPGESVVFVNLKDTVAAKAVPDLWYQVHKKIDDIRQKSSYPGGIADVDRDEAFRTLHRLHAVKDRVTVVPTHDHGAARRLVSPNSLVP